MKKFYLLLIVSLILIIDNNSVFSQENPNKTHILTNIKYDRSILQDTIEYERKIKEIKNRKSYKSNIELLSITDNFIADSYEGGDGSPEDPYQIAKAEQLALLAQQTNDGIGGDACYILTNDIDLNEYNWKPIGYNSENPFTGIFDENHHTIGNLNIKEQPGLLGLFGAIEKATIKNIILKNVNIIWFPEPGDQRYVMIGAIAALNIDSHIYNCITESGDISSGNADFLGGIVGGIIATGDQNDTTYIKNCVNHMSLFNDWEVAGICGTTYQDSSNIVIEKCINYGTLESMFIVAGIVAHSGTGCIIRSCDNYGIMVNAACSGGILGQVQEYALVKDCINHESAEIHGNTAGGIVGTALSGYIERCGNRGLVYAHSESSTLIAGGIAGCDGNISNCYNIGTINGDIDETITYFVQVGGITGTPPYSIYNVYNAGEIVTTTSPHLITELYAHITPAIRSTVSVSNCFWYGNEQLADKVFNMGSSNNVEIPVSSKFVEGATASSWVLNKAQYGVDDLLEVLNAGTMGSEEEYIWREDFDNENNGFPIIERFIYDDIKDINSEVAQLSIYPNPTKDYIKLSSTDDLMSVIKIFNNAGMLVKEFEVNANELDVNISDLIAGIYFIHVYSNNKFSCHKIIKI